MVKGLIVLAVAIALTSPAAAAKKKRHHHPKPQQIAQQCVMPYQQSFFGGCEYRPALLMTGVAP